MESTIKRISNDTEKKMNDLHNMSWLKRNSQTPTEYKNFTELKEIVPKSQNMEDYISGSKPVKKRKSKRIKGGSSIEPILANSKNSDTDTEQSLKKHGKRNLKNLPVNAETVTSSATAWNTKTNAASTLFPDSKGQVEIFKEEIEIIKALEESIITAQLDQFKLTPEKSTVNWADDSEEPGWDTVRQNLPEKPEDNANTERKIEKKAHDDNNNSANKSSTGKEENPQGVDKYGRVGGYSERHLFLGKGARLKEHQPLIGYQSNRDNRRSPVRIHEKSDCEQFSRSDSYDNRNRGHRDFGERNLSDNRSTNSDERREYRNRNFSFANQRGRLENNHQRYNNYQNRYDNQFHKYDNQSHRSENPSHWHKNYNQRQDNQLKRHDNQHNYGHQYRKYENQHKFGNNKRDIPNRVQSHNPPSHKEEFKTRNVKFEEKEPSDCEENTTLQNQDTPEKEAIFENLHTEYIKQNLSRSSTPILEEEKESYDKPVQNNEQITETTSEENEYQEKQVPTIPFEPNTRPFPIHVVHPSGVMCQNPEPNVQIHNGMTYNMITNPFIAPVPVPNPPHYQHTHEMVASEGMCPTVPIQNMGMRFYPQHPMNLVHNHPVNSFVPIANYPMGIPIHSCAQIPQIPVGNVQGLNYMQHPMNCQQCPPHYCQSQRIPLQNLNYQNSIYPPQFVTPVTTVPLPMAPLSSNQIGKTAQSVKIETPANEIGRSVTNLVSLCENLPSRRRVSYTNCPPGFENGSLINPNIAQKKIIFDKVQTALPSFRNNPKECFEEGRRKKEEFTDEKLNDIYKEINNDSKNTEKDVKTQNKWPGKTIKFSENSYNEQLLKSYLDVEKKQSNSINQAPRPGFRVGIGRGKRLGRTT